MSVPFMNLFTYSCDENNAGTQIVGEYVIVHSLNPIKKGREVSPVFLKI